FPRRLSMRGLDFDLDYRFDPGAGDDGVTMTVPLAMLNQVDAARCEWLVPGMLKDKVQALAKSLPQRSRRHLVPLAAWADGFVERWRGREGSCALVDALIEDLREERGMRVGAADFRPETLSPHLSMNFRVVDAHGGVLATSRQLAALRADHGPRAQGAFQAAFAALGAPIAAAPPAVAAASAHDGAAPSGAVVPAPAATPADHLPGAGRRYTDWSFGTLPELMELTQRVGGREQTAIGYPALVDAGDAVELQLFDDPEQAAGRHRAGLARLFAIALREPLKYFEKHIPDFQRMSLLFAGFGGAEDLRRELVAALLERTCLVEPLPADPAAFAARVSD